MAYLVAMDRSLTRCWSPYPAVHSDWLRTSSIEHATFACRYDLNPRRPLLKMREPGTNQPRDPRCLVALPKETVPTSEEFPCPCEDSEAVAAHGSFGVISPPTGLHHPPRHLPSRSPLGEQFVNCEPTTGEQFELINQRAATHPATPSHVSNDASTIWRNCLSQTARAHPAPPHERHLLCRPLVWHKDCSALGVIRHANGIT